MNYQVHVLKIGQSDVPGPEVYWMGHWDQWLTLYFYMVVIRGGGKTAIVNTGPPLDLTEMNEQWAAYAGPRCRMLRDPAERPDAALATLGIRPENVTHVLITPLQSYATGNIPLFRNAEVCISRRGWIEDFHAPRFPVHSPRRTRIPDDVLMYLDIEAPEKVRLLGDVEEILPGLRARWVGVHHRSSMAFEVDTVRGCVTISDAAFHYGNVENMHPLGILESMDECHVAYERFRKAEVFIPLYDPAVLERYPGGLIAS
jgi:glyoxylase-like metal-dependent hydrolase (beta-lactamase superfamily II)